LKLNATTVARNTVFNFFGQAIPLLVGVVTIPFIVRGLGTDRFGILSLVWIVLGYFTLFDLGLGRATTKFVAEAMGKGEQEKVPHLVWTTVTVQGCLGIVGSLVLASVTPLLVERILNIPSELVKETETTIYLVALAIPAVLVSNSLSGVLEASQRFDLVNAVKIPASISTFVLPLIGLLLGFRLTGIVMLMLISRFIVLATLALLNLRVFPTLIRFSASLAIFSRLLGYGGWITLSNFIIPIFVYLDRFLIGSILTMTDVTYYTAPFELANKLLIIPASIAAVIFPASSSLVSQNSRHELNAGVMRSIKYLVTVMAPPTVLVLIFAEGILRIWLGNEFATGSTTVLRLLCIAVLLNGIGYIPFALIQGIGRPDVVAKYHLIELPIYAGVIYFFITRFGINGAAFAWCLRMLWTIPIFSILCVKIAGVSLRSFSETRLNRSLLLTAGLLIVSIIIILFGYRDIIVMGLISVVLLILYGFLVWSFVFDRFDKDFIKRISGPRSKFLFERRS